MEKIKLFYQPRCPFCKRAFAFIDELIAENPQFANIEIERIDELLHPDYADQFDYYYVPTFYVGNRKAHEGGIFKEEVRRLLQSVIDGTRYEQPQD